MPLAASPLTARATLQAKPALLARPAPRAPQVVKARQSLQRLRAAQSQRRSPSTRPQRKIYDFVAACVIGAGARASAVRSRLGRRSSATATPVPAKKKPFSWLFAPVAFEQWTDWPTEFGSGVTTAVVALPLAMAFGVASGVGPLAGLYGAIFTGFFAALFGGTPAQVTGPTGPMAVVMASVIAKYQDPRLAFGVVVLAGLMQVVMGVLRLGGAIRLVPRTVLSGFMTGIGGIICSLQTPVLLGHAGGGQVVKVLMTLPVALAAPNFAAVAVALITFFMLYKFPEKLTFKVPRPLLALLSASVFDRLVLANMGLSVPSLGAIPAGLPSIQVPPIDMTNVGPLALTAVVLAILGAIDSLLTSLVADSLTSSFHDSDRELVGQGIGNTVAGLFGGHAGAGATMRTVVNVRSGGRTPISGATHSIVLLAAVTGLGPLARYVPLSCLAAILIKSGLDVVDWQLLKRAKGLPYAELAIFVLTFGMTVFVDLIVAVVAGWALAILVLFYKTSKLQLSSAGVQLFDATTATGAPAAIQQVLQKAQKASVVQLKGQVTFSAAVGLLRKLVPQVVGKETVIIELSDVVMIDTSAILCLEELLEKVTDKGGLAFVCGAKRDMEGFDLLESLELANTATNDSVENSITDLVV